MRSAIHAKSFCKCAFQTDCYGRSIVVWLGKFCRWKDALRLAAGTEGEGLGEKGGGK